MNGKLVGSFIVIAALLVGAGIYYAQVYAYYTEVVAGSDASRMTLVSITSNRPEEIVAEGFQGIDASSSPIRFRACFTVPQSLAMLSETYVAMDEAVPLTGPSWFSCYDANAIGDALEAGEALAFLSQHDIHPGVDRVIAVFPDGRAFAWNQTNDELDTPNPVRQ